MTKKAPSIPSTKLVDLVKKGIEEKKGEEIVTLDIYKMNPSVCDYFVICHGNSNTHVASIAEQIQKTLREEMEERPYHVEGLSNSEWVLIDFVSVVVHVFQKEFRDFYDLEHLWAD
ncbi:MAG: ribosome silencing factor [Vicingaceae bacterium]